MKAICCAAALAALCVPATAIAQDAPQPERMGDEVGWARVSYVKFHAGKRERGLEIIRDYFAKADRMTGNDSGVHGIHFNSGEWDAMYVFPMKGGPSDMTWLTSPEDIAWMGKMAELAGGMEAAEAILGEWDSLVAREETDIGHYHPDY
ncbi:hypothetical protein [Sphingomicrobium astaxanthinifaciens]|uniref:hypothetical protein n=1 Tax=Sphingomicrobium astaxanthinifaciens TaxID=1227949 RepID=UPI001FCA5A82|nr:hypothetical protein [Sphingomicrobium astaxanthinifaciens]MCJ7420875.1 hypothetical protein [Sphingomicrobium astaxanthinifaciens]